MANKDHLELLKQGVLMWNDWRTKNPEVKPDLSESNLRVSRLKGANLRGVDLRDVDLKGANLEGADLCEARLSGADLRGMWFDSADMRVLESEMFVTDGYFLDIDFDGDPIFREVDLHGANLSGAILFKANLGIANLTGANLENALLAHCDLTDANLGGANLRHANLTFVNLTGADLTDADLANAIIYDTTFGDNDLSVVRGLDAVKHQGPSNIGLRTIIRSKGNIPQAFLRGAGVPDPFIEHLTSLAQRSIQFHSCFISYSSKDQAFAERLHEDLENSGVRCWFAPEDLKIGEKIRVGIDESIRKHDKLLLVLSKHSVSSQWVEKEVETAFERERKQNGTVLFPIRLDNTVMKIESGWPADIRRTHNIGDFRHWKLDEAYQKAFERLMRDLKAKA